MSKEKKYVLYGLIVILIAALGTTLAYFVANIVGDRKPISVNATNLKITFNKGDDGSIEASDIEPGSLDITKTFSITNETNTDYSYNLIFKDYINTFKTTGFLVYKVTSTDGGYNMTDFADMPKLYNTGKTVIKYSINLPANSTHNYTIQIKYLSSDTVDQSDDMEKEVSGKIYAEEGTQMPTLAQAMLRDNPTISEKTDFGQLFTDMNTGTLFKTNKTEDGSEVYYYSGDTTNNWVKFGKYQDDRIGYRGYKNAKKMDFHEYKTMSECTSATSYNIDCTEYKYASAGDDIYWRIIRTNEDGSVRLLYSGTSSDTTLGYIGTSEFNSSHRDPLYVGYMYGTSGSLVNNRTNTNSSIIKKYIDSWYENNILTNYDKYISKTAIYCNDRSIGSGNYSTSSTFYYGAGTRLDTNKAPSYKCGANTSNGLFESAQAIEDKFSASTEGGGNGQLQYPIALMTADEVSFAGGKVNQAYLKGFYYWYVNSDKNPITDVDWILLSPYDWDGHLSYVFSIVMNLSVEVFGGLNPIALTSVQTAIRPVISLSSCVKVTGTGTPENPYEIDENSCS